MAPPLASVEIDQCRQDLTQMLKLNHNSNIILIRIWKTMYFNKDVRLRSVFQILTNTVVFKLKDKWVEYHASL